MKLIAKKGMDLADIAPFLSPVEAFGEEKIQSGSYDDWDEKQHTEKWLKRVLASINAGREDRLALYWLEEDGQIIGVAFSLCNSNILLGTLEKDGISPTHEHIAQVTCFHILERCRGRGIGRSWLENEVFPDLRNAGIQSVYIRSSHHRALPLYESLGKKVGNYISVSDHQMYQRYGYVYQLTL